MSTQNSNASQNNSNDAIATRYMSGIARGLLLAVEGEKKQKLGQAYAAVGLVMMLKERSNDEAEFEKMVRHIKGAHCDGKKEPEAYAAAWRFWSDELNTANLNKRASIQFATVELTEAEQERLKQMDLALKQATKAPKQAQVRTLRFACSVAFAFIAARVVWSGVSCSKDMDALIVDDATMRKLLPNRDMSNNKLPLLAIETYGHYRLSNIAKSGNDALVKASVRKAPPASKVKIEAMRDTAKRFTKTVIEADEKAIDNDTVIEMYSLMVALVNRLNAHDVTKHRMPNNIAAPLIDFATPVVEAALNKADIVKANPPTDGGATNVMAEIKAKIEEAKSKSKAA